MFGSNTLFAHSRFDSKFIGFYTFFNRNDFTYDQQNGTYIVRPMERRMNMSINFLMISKYLNLVKDRRIILEQIEKSQVVLNQSWKCVNGL